MLRFTVPAVTHRRYKYEMWIRSTIAAFIQTGHRWPPDPQNFTAVGEERDRRHRWDIVDGEPQGSVSPAITGSPMNSLVKQGLGDQIVDAEGNGIVLCNCHRRCSLCS